MLTSAVVNVIEFCTRNAWRVIAASMVLALLCGAYAARNFAITSDVNALLSPNLEWRKRELAFEKTFGVADAFAGDLQAFLQGLPGMERGDRVAIMSPNLLQYPVALFGILRAGLVVEVAPMRRRSSERATSPRP